MTSRRMRVGEASRMAASRILVPGSPNTVQGAHTLSESPPAASWSPAALILFTVLILYTPAVLIPYTLLVPGSLYTVLGHRAHTLSESTSVR